MSDGIRQMWILTLMLLVLPLITISAFGSSGDESKMIFSYEQNTEGVGFFNIYKNALVQPEPSSPYSTRYVDLDTVTSKTKKHGSGSLNSEGIFVAQRVSEHNDYGAYGVLWWENRTDKEICRISEDVEDKLTYAPITISMATGYYNTNPIKYDSSITRDTCIKNYQTGNSIHHGIKHAEVAKTNQQFLVDNSDYCEYYHGPNHYTTDDDDSFSLRNSTTNMQISEDVIGTIHLGAINVVKTEDSTGTIYIPGAIDIPKDQKNKLLTKTYVEEDYIGEYSLDRNITFETKEPYNAIWFNYLTCCFGGYEDADYHMWEAGNMSCFAP